MRFFQQVIYYSCFWLYKTTLKLCHFEIKAIWYRNSFCFDYWVFLKSDIDITIVLESANKKLIQDISYTHSLFRRYLPVIGELVVFSEAHMDSMLKCVNPYELSRDPILVSKYSLKKEPDHYDKVVFLHKFISSNWFKENINSKRKGKIRYYSSLIGLKKDLPFLSLVTELALMTEMDLIQFESDYKKNIEQTDIYKNFEFPNYIYSFFYNNLCYLKPPLPLNEVEKKILEKILLWELWGCFSYQASIDEIELEKHFIRIIDQLDILTNPEFAQTFTQLAEDLELFKK